MLRLFPFVVLIAACGHELPGPPSVVIVTIDTLRADAVGPRTPRIQAFLESARHFRGARTVVPLTVPAHLSLFSGLSPARHAVPDNCTAGVGPDRGYTLLAEEFRDAGYATAAFVASTVLDRHTGLAAGFGHFECPARGAGNEGEMTAEQRIRAPLAWLAHRRGDEPFLLWVHLFDPHYPYGPDSDRCTMERRREMYAEEVARADAGFGAILAAVPDDAIVVLASDHGEGLGDHGEPKHGLTCWSTVVDALLAVRCTALDAGSVDDAPRSLVDVPPTLRAWCGLPDRPHDGLPLFESRARVVVAESLAGWREYGWGQVLAATDGAVTLIEAGRSVALFDRRADPHELNPLPDLAAHPAYERLDRALQRYRTEAFGRDTPPISLENGSPYGHARIPKSSYLARRDNARLPDPTQRFDQIERLHEAQLLVATGIASDGEPLVSRALKLFAALEQEDPGNPAFHYQALHAFAAHAEMLRARDRRDEQADAARHAVASGLRAVECGYTLAAVLEPLARQAVATGDRERMRAVLDVALSRRIVPDLRAARGVLALARALGAQDERFQAYVQWAETGLSPADRATLHRLAAE